MTTLPVILFLSLGLALWAVYLGEHWFQRLVAVALWLAIAVLIYLARP